MKRVLGVVVVVLAAGLLAGLSTQPTRAEVNGLKVWILGEKPVRVEKRLNEGESFASQIEIQNNNDETVTVSLTPSPYSYGPANEYLPDYSTQKAYTQLANWIRLPRGDKYNIMAGETISVDYNFTVPEGAIGGSQSAAILIHTEQPEESTRDVGVSGRSNFAYVIIANINGQSLREGGQVVRWDTPWIVLDESEIKIESAIENTGNINFMADYKLTINEWFDSQKIAYQESKRVDVLPESGRMVDHKWADAPALGLFKVKEEVKFLDETKMFERTVLIFPMWLLIIVIAIILLLVTALVLKIRSYREEKQMS
jgi:hypothetical protein